MKSRVGLPYLTGSPDLDGDPVSQYISYFLFIVVFNFLSNLSHVVLVFMVWSFDMTFDTILSFELCYCVSSLFLIMKKAGKWK